MTFSTFSRLWAFMAPSGGSRFGSSVAAFAVAFFLLPMSAPAAEEDMRDLFAKGRAEPLDFGIGYRWRSNESSLLLAVRRP